MRWVYLSPHLDDVALSLGGLVWQQARASEPVTIWTICSGDPPVGDFSPFAEALHARWETGAQAMHIRRAEDITSCRLLGARYVHLGLPDCIYRRSAHSGTPLYASEEALWSPIHPDEAGLVAQLAAQMAALMPAGAQLVSPIGIGGHVDHRLTRAAAESLGVPLRYYADYPYVAKNENARHLEGLPALGYPLSTAAIGAWQRAVAAHRSQISSFWPDDAAMRAAIHAYAQQMEGAKLFERPTPNP